MYSKIDWVMAVQLWEHTKTFEFYTLNKYGIQIISE